MYRIEFRLVPPGVDWQKADVFFRTPIHLTEAMHGLGIKLSDYADSQAQVLADAFWVECRWNYEGSSLGQHLRPQGDAPKGLKDVSREWRRRAAKRIKRERQLRPGLWNNLRLRNVRDRVHLVHDREQGGDPPEEAMIILLKAWTMDEHVEPRADYAVVDVSPKYAQWMLGLIEAAEELRSEYNGLYCISLFEYGPDWLETSEELDEIFGGGTDAERIMPEVYLVSEETWTRIKDEAQGVRQDATTMRVQVDGVMWHSYIKHTDAAMETAEIPKELLERIAKGDGQ